MSSDQSPDSFDAIVGKLQQATEDLKNNADPKQRKAMLQQFRRLLDQADKLSEKLLWKSD
jgi:hypothetical protein